MLLYSLAMMSVRFIILCGLAMTTLATPARAQVAPVPYLTSVGSFGFGGTIETQYFGNAVDDDGFRKGFSFSRFSAPVSSFRSGFGLGAFGNAAGLTSDGAQYGYSFKGIGDTPVTLFGGVTSLRTSPDVFTSLVTPGFERTNTLATGFNAGVEFKPAPNVSLSLSGSFVQPSATTDTDLRSQLISAQQPSFRNWR